MIALVPASLAVVTIIWELRHHKENPYPLDSMPFFFLFLSNVPYELLNPDHYSKRKALRLGIQNILLAFGFLALCWWNPLPSSFSFQKLGLFFYELGLSEDLLAWMTVFIFAWGATKVIQAEWPRLTASAPFE
jgi:hypothetical protein